MIQFITDATDCVKAGIKNYGDYEGNMWTPCAAHCIDLMLEDIAKLKISLGTTENAKRVVNFIYGHGISPALIGFI